MPHLPAKVHRMFELVEPIATITYSEVPSEAFLALGMRNYLDAYFAGRAAPLGLAPAEVVHAVFYNFADGEVARHIPWVWGKTTPQEAIAVRERGSATALRQPGALRRRGERHRPGIFRLHGRTQKGGSPRWSSPRAVRPGRGTGGPRRDLRSAPC